jgi:hypothetical protein
LSNNSPSTKLLAIAGRPIFLDQSENKIIKLRMGDGYNEWTLRHVWRRKALLEKNNVTTVLVVPTPDLKPAQSTQAAEESDGKLSQH